jgi:hypothetical protein
MKAKLNKVDNGYVLLVDNIMYATDNDKLSKQNCDELFGVVDVEELTEEECLDETYWVKSFYKKGFNKAMELYQPTEIDVEIEMEDIIQLKKRAGGLTNMGKPKLDSNGNLILRKL